MRKIIEKQLKFGQVDISSIELDLRFRDEIPQLLVGLKAIYANRETRTTYLQSWAILFLRTLIPGMADQGWICGQFWCLILQQNSGVGVKPLF